MRAASGVNNNAPLIIIYPSLWLRVCERDMFSGICIIKLKVRVWALPWQAAFQKTSPEDPRTGPRRCTQFPAGCRRCWRDRPNTLVNANPNPMHPRAQRVATKTLHAVDSSVALVLDAPLRVTGADANVHTPPATDPTTGPSPGGNGGDEEAPHNRHSGMALPLAARPYMCG